MGPHHLFRTNVAAKHYLTHNEGLAHLPATTPTTTLEITATAIKIGKGLAKRAEIIAHSTRIRATTANNRTTLKIPNFFLSIRRKLLTMSASSNRYDKWFFTRANSMLTYINSSCATDTRNDISGNNTSNNGFTESCSPGRSHGSCTT